MYRLDRREIARIPVMGPQTARSPSGGIVMASWWEQYPQEFEAEMDALRASDFQWEIRQDDREQGRLVIDLQVTHEGVAFELTAEYPDSYPTFRHR